MSNVDENNIYPIRIAQIMGKWIGGGVESVVMNYYRHIDKNKIQFDFFCDEDSTNIPYEEIEKLGGKVVLIPPYQKVFKYHKELKRVLKEENYKIVHSHINTLSVFSLFAAKCAGVPIRIAHSHSTTNKKEKKKNLIKQVLKPFSKLFATDYMACSELAGRWLFGNKEYDKGNVFLLNNAIDLDKFKYDENIRKEKRKELNIEDDTLVIGHVGRFVEQKNHRFLIDIFNEVHKQNSNSILLLVGQGPLMEEIKEKVKKLDLTDYVKFLGQRDDINELYQAFDVFLLPSLYEGLGMVLIEAQTAGLPCIVSTEVPRNVDISSNVCFFSLKENSKKCSKIILNNKNFFKRKAYNEEASKNGYDIKKECLNLENKYLNMNKINVCHVVSALESGGVESVIYNYCSHMDLSKFNMHILYQRHVSQKNYEEFSKLGFKLYEIPEKIRHPIKNYFYTKKYFRDNSINVVHAHMTLVNFIPLIAAKKCNIKIRISHSHNSDVRKKTILKKFFEKIMKNLTIKYSTYNLACGIDAGKYLYGKQNFIILNNALDLNRYLYNFNIRKKLMEKYNIDESTLIIGNIGRFTVQKNQKFLIDIFSEVYKQNKNSILLIIGDGKLREELEKKVKELNLINNIIFTGIVNNTNEYYSLMDIFVLPSLWEGLPIAGIEAQVSGLKCLFSNKIDNDVIVIENNVKKLDLKLNEWSREILSISKNYNRNIDKKIFSNRGFDICNEAKKIENIYLGKKDN